MEYLDELDDSALQALAELGVADIDFSMSTSSTSSSGASSSSSQRSARRRRVEATYLLRLEHPLASPRDVADALNLPRLPQLESGVGEDGEEYFCRLTQSQINALDQWTAEYHPRKRFTKVRLGAHKDPLELPILGRDATLPHYRPNSTGIQQTKDSDGHKASEFPVDYFFYGTLASLPFLSQRFDVPVDQLPPLEPAILLDGRIQTWGGKYRALVDHPGSKVEGVVFSVQSQEQEQELMRYEGDNYEVVRAKVVVDGTEIEARTFRFAGCDDELDK